MEDSSPQPSGTPRTGRSVVLFKELELLLTLPLLLLLELLVVLELNSEVELLLPFGIRGDKGPLSDPRLVGGVEP